MCIYRDIKKEGSNKQLEVKSLKSKSKLNRDTLTFLNLTPISCPYSSSEAQILKTLQISLTWALDQG